MRFQQARLAAAFFALAIAAALMSVRPIGAEQFMVNSGTVFFYSNPAVGAKGIPSWTLMFEIPSTLDTDSESQEVFCALNAEKVIGDDERQGVRKVTARWTSRLYVLDRATAELTVTEVTGGRVKTNAEGRGEFTFDLPTELFADGFESGQVGAWVSVTFDVKKSRQAMDSRAECFAVDDL